MISAASFNYYQECLIELGDLAVQVTQVPIGQEKDARRLIIEALALADTLPTGFVTYDVD